MVTKSPMDYQTFRKLCYRWQVRLTKTFGIVLGKEDTEYVIIRNCLILMTKLTPAFPLIASGVTGMESTAVKLRDREKGKRDDLSLKAASYVGRLKMRNVTVYQVASDFAPVLVKKVSMDKPKKVEKAEGEPVDKKLKVEGKNGKEEAENGVEKTAGDEQKERKKRVKTALYVAPKGGEKKEEPKDEGEVKTPSPPPTKKTKISDRLKRPEEEEKKEPDAEKEKKRSEKTRKDGKEKRSEKKRENGEAAKKEEKVKEEKPKEEKREEKKVKERRDVAGPLVSCFSTAVQADSGQSDPCQSALAHTRQI